MIRVSMMDKESKMKLRTTLLTVLMLLIALPALSQAPRTVFAELGSATW